MACGCSTGWWRSTTRAEGRRAHAGSRRGATAGALTSAGPGRMIGVRFRRGTPALLLESWTRPWLTDVMAFCYFVFLPYLFLSLAWYFFRPIALAQRFWAGLFTLYGIGFLGYSLVPAGGPWLALADRFTIPLEGSAPTATLLGIIAAGTNGVDVFPSLHCAVSAYCLFFDRRHARWRYYAYLGPCIVLWASTLYLRYHYLVDLAAGFALAAFATWVAKRFEPCPVPETAA